MANRPQTITEITPLSAKDCFYVADRLKDKFNYPLHCHSAYELNYVQNAEGAQRIVGDSVETIGNYDLVLIANPNLVHSWVQGEQQLSTQIHEITIQMQPDVFYDTIMSKAIYSDIAYMLQRAQLGLCFSWRAVLDNHQLVSRIAEEQDRFMKNLHIWHLLYNLAQDKDARVLASSAFNNVATAHDSDRVHKVEQYIKEHYFEDICLNDLAKLTNMTAVSFSRFFKLHTGRTVSEYLIDIRLGYAAHELVNSNSPTAEIAYACGFNNLSNFNRLFKKYRSMSPSEFKRIYRKNTFII